jgi:hypothetical protein
MSRNIVLSVPLLLLTVTPLFNRQQPTTADSKIQIGGFDLQLRMGQDEALRMFVLVYDVQHQDNIAGTWTIVKKGGPPFEIVGLMTFRLGKLVFASKSWGPSAENQTASGLGLALHDALRALYQGRQRNCVVSTDTAGTVGVQTKIQCGRRQLSVFASRDPSTSSAVSESITAAQ